MAATGFVITGTAASVDRAGNTAWTSPTFVQADDSSFATAAVPTDYLVCTNFDFSSIPGGSTIDGVQVRVNASETGTGNSNYTAQLISDATPTLIGSSANSGTVTGTTKTDYDTGGVSDTWGATLNTGVVKNSGFGVAVWSTDTTNTLSVDYVQIQITYTAITGASTLTFTPSGSLVSVTLPSIIFQNYMGVDVGDGMGCAEKIR